MFKFIFRTITTVLFLVVLTVVLAVWKGGEPFRWIGKKTEAVGRSIIQFGEFIDELREGGKKTQEAFEQLRDTFKDGETR
jgi:hypothetical protein